MDAAKLLPRTPVRRHNLAGCPPRKQPPHRTEEPALHVLFVCTGNICRSPTAERLAAAHGADIPDFVASSAGTRAMIGHPVHPDAARVLQDLGGDPAGFAARQLTPKITSGVDLVIAMTRPHRDAVLELAPRLLRRSFTLTEAAALVSQFGARTVDDLAALRPQLSQADAADIPDPIGQDLEFFTRTGTLIDELIRPVIELCRQSSATA